MEMVWDGSFELLWIIMAVTIGTIYWRSRAEISICMPAASRRFTGHVLLERITMGAIPHGTLSAAIRLPRKLPPPFRETAEELSPLR